MKLTNENRWEPYYSLMVSRYITKSRFKTAHDCPAKLYYYDRPEIYGNKNSENPFLEALAQGGFQVGALAKLYFEDGIDLEGLKTEEAITRTDELLVQENVTVFEAALHTGPFLVRVDVLEKRGNKVRLIEVKSKSFDSSEGNGFFKSRGHGLDSIWKPYLIDVGFQTWVARTAHPDWDVAPFLMLPDKSIQATVDGLHQHFRLEARDHRSVNVITSPGLGLHTMGDPILKVVDVKAEVKHVIEVEKFPMDLSLAQYAEYLASQQAAGTKGTPQIGAVCKNCEFKCEGDLKNGFQECWLETGRMRPMDLSRNHIFDIWNFRRTEELLSRGKVFFDQVTQDDLAPRAQASQSKKAVRTLEPWQRQWLQVEKAVKKDPAPYVDLPGLRALFSGVTYPLHCIDFETTMVAIPFHRGRRPYEQIAFQFSHHVLHEDGKTEHVDQYIDMRPGLFPNFDFVRRLKQSLEGDRGSIFRFAAHENTVLRQIRDQIEDTPPHDAKELTDFIDEITRPRGGEEGEPGLRDMIDLRECVVEFYYHPLMGKSNSIKKVIPAVLEESSMLKQKYAKPIYGKKHEIKSLNFEEMAWIELDKDGHVRDPYKRLPPVFKDISQAEFEASSFLFNDDSIDDGGAAMTAWSRMQFTEMPDLERDAIEQALLRYCELDTLSMIWLLEYWRDLITSSSGSGSQAF